MDWKSFNAQRAYLNHNVLKNEILARLCDAPDLIVQRDLEVDKRAEQLAIRISEARISCATAESVVSVWQREPKNGRPTGESISDLLRSLRSMRGVRLGPRFPSDDDLAGYVGRIDDLIGAIHHLADIPAADRSALAVEFWESALKLHDLLHALNPYGTAFSSYVSLD